MLCKPQQSDLIDLVSVAVRLFELRLVFERVARLHQIGEIDQDYCLHDASTYDRLIALLDQHNAQYRLIDHPAEGRTEIVSPMRGNELRKARRSSALGTTVEWVSGFLRQAYLSRDNRLHLATADAVPRHSRLDRGESQWRRDRDCSLFLPSIDIDDRRQLLHSGSVRFRFRTEVRGWSSTCARCRRGRA
jgi:hypothetical protein